MLTPARQRGNVAATPARGSSGHLAVCGESPEWTKLVQFRTETKNLRAQNGPCWSISDLRRGLLVLLGHKKISLRVSICEKYSEPVI
jgi:hypothetical protein